MTDEGVVLHLRLRVAPQRRAELFAFLREAIPFYEAPGEIRVRVLQSRADPDELIEEVRYATCADFDRDEARVREDPEMQRTLARWRALLDGPPRVDAWDEVRI